MERQELKSSVFSCEALSGFRTALMGLATLNVMLLHIFQQFELLGSELIFYVFESGADMFVLLSGFGLFYSAKKQEPLPVYYKKRFLRIYPEYIISCVLSGLLNSKGILWVCQELTTSSFWINGSTSYWFISLILILYIIYPLAHKFIVRSDVFAFALIVITLIIDIVLPFVIGDLYWPKAILLERIPVFFAGVLIAKKIKEGKLVFESERILYFVVVAMASLIMTKHVAGAHYRLMLLPWTISIVVVLAYILSKTKEGNKAVKATEALGRISLQVYLFHGLLTLWMINNITSINKPLMIALSVIASLTAAYAVKLICDRIRAVLLKQKKA